MKFAPELGLLLITDSVSLSCPKPLKIWSYLLLSRASSILGIFPGFLTGNCTKLYSETGSSFFSQGTTYNYIVSYSFLDVNPQQDPKQYTFGDFLRSPNQQPMIVAALRSPQQFTVGLRLTAGLLLEASL